MSKKPKYQHIENKRKKMIEIENNKTFYKYKSPSSNKPEIKFKNHTQQIM